VARIELCNLEKSFGAVKAVKGLNFVIEDGEFIVFVGPSGCGKTTTLRMIAGFEDPTGGEIRIDGIVVNDLEPRDRGLGMVFQSHALFPHKNVAQNIEFGLRMRKVPPEERVRRVREVADMVRIGHLLDKMPGQCSGGETSRCPASTPSCAANCALNATACIRRSSEPSSSSRMTRKKR
jgi:ABC-type sugar transport system ATPase subunit